MICRFFVAFGLLWVGRRLTRGIDGQASRTIEEFGCAIAPLVLFALFWLLADSGQRPRANGVSLRHRGGRIA
jgi:hypothetical protein